MDLKHIRKEYVRGGLTEKDTPPNPIALFERWLDEAIRAGVDEPTAMWVATVSPQGRPSGRTVLLKEVEDGKFVFYTNYESRKGRHLAHNPFASLSFVWHALERQVHIEGRVEKIAPEKSDLYFQSRPYKSRIGARISPQSQPIAGRGFLIRRFVRETVSQGRGEVKRPAWWGGYAVIPDRIEFWQGRANRLHDRILYTLQPADGSWKKERLAP